MSQRSGPLTKCLQLGVIKVWDYSRRVEIVKRWGVKAGTPNVKDTSATTSVSTKHLRDVWLVGGLRSIRTLFTSLLTFGNQAYIVLHMYQKLINGRVVMVEDELPKRALKPVNLVPSERVVREYRLAKEDQKQNLLLMEQVAKSKSKKRKAAIKAWKRRTK